MMTIEAAALAGLALDLAVAKAQGLLPIPNQPPGFFYWTDERGFARSGLFNPSESWELGGPIIERERIAFLHIPEGVDYLWKRVNVGARWLASAPAEGVSAFSEWSCSDDDECFADGPTPLIAAMRAYVASKGE